MANGVFNIAKGRAKEYYSRVKSNDPAGSELVLILCTGTETDDNIEAADTITAVLATTLAECTFTNYVRKDLTDTLLAAVPAPDDAADDNSYTLPDTTWTSAGGASNDTITRIIVAYDSTGTDADSALVPLTFHDFSLTTNGGDVNGFR
jgi:hypothetical protein